MDTESGHHRTDSQESFRLIQKTGKIDCSYRQYEISAHALPGYECRHNLNYWEFGDYLGIGAGAHAKLTDGDGRIRRFTRQRHPQRYLDAAVEKVSSERELADAELPIEFMLNALRLPAGVPAGLFEERTGLPLSGIADQLDEARERGLLEYLPGHLRPTRLGTRFLNDLLAIFEPRDSQQAGPS